VEVNAAGLASVGAAAKITALDYDTTFCCKPKRVGYSQAMNKTFDCYGKTQSEIKAHLKRTRKTRVRELCAKHNTTSYAQAQHLDTLDLCARIQAHLAAKKISS
jgi:hypothetical protein